MYFLAAPVFVLVATGWVGSTVAVALCRQDLIDRLSNHCDPNTECYLNGVVPSQRYGQSLFFLNNSIILTYLPTFQTFCIFNQTYLTMKMVLLKSYIILIKQKGTATFYNVLPFRFYAVLYIQPVHRVSYLHRLILFTIIWCKDKSNLCTSHSNPRWFCNKKGLHQGGPVYLTVTNSIGVICE